MMPRYLHSFLLRASHREKFSMKAPRINGKCLWPGMCLTFSHPREIHLQFVRT
jgi:hypothetical protein